nr:RHS repeat-associated core domain-containing protein [Lysobacter silvestris]
MTRALVFILAWFCVANAHAQVVEYVHTDALGSPVAITNESAQVIDRTDYEPYGNLIGKVNNDRPGYTGHVMDSATGLTYMQQRYYDPTIGRFLSTDPVQANANTGALFNRFAYASNNPYKFTDPDGRQDAYYHVQAIVDGWRRTADWVQKKFDTAVAKTDVRVQADVCSGACVSVDQSILHGDGNLSITPVGWAGGSPSKGGQGAFVGVFVQPREGLVVTEGAKAGANSPVNAASGAEVKYGEGLAAGADVQVSPTGKSEVTPKVGLGVGEVTKPLEVKLFKWDFSKKPEDKSDK